MLALGLEWYWALHIVLYSVQHFIQNQSGWLKWPIFRGGACMHGLTLGVLSGRPMGANWMVDWQLFGPPTFLTQQSSWYVLLLLNTHDSGSFYNPSPTYSPKIVLRETRNDNPQLGFGFSASKMHNPSPYPGDIMRWLVEACLEVGLHLFRGICFFFPILFLRFCYCSYMTVIYRVIFFRKTPNIQPE